MQPQGDQLTANEVSNELVIVWISIAIYMALMMQMGFIFRQAGSTRWRKI